MSSWHYQIMRHTADSGEDYLAIHEFYWTDTKQERHGRPSPCRSRQTA
jgi:hypothetical protein